MPEISRFWRVNLAAAIVLYLWACWSLLRPGYVLTLDMAFGPASAPGGLGFWYQHAVFAGIFLGGFAAAAGLCGALLTRIGLPSLPGATAGAAFYLLNPFVYQRLLAGQWLFLIGYALLPLMMSAGFSAGEPAATRRAWGVACVAYLAAAVCSPHFLAIGAFALLSGLVLPTGVSARGRLQGWLGLGLVTATGSALVAWLRPGAAPAVRGIGLQDFIYYGSRPDPAYGWLGNLATLHGFWREGVEMIPYRAGPAWAAGAVAASAVVVFGWWIARVQRRIFCYLTGVYVAAFVLALGLSPYTYRLTEWLLATFPHYAGFRDTQKFSALPALVYAISFAAGAGALWMRRRRLGLRVGTWGLTLALGVALSPGLLAFWGGLRGQVAPVSYPPAWHEARAYLDRRPATDRVVEVPFQMYQTYAFNARISQSALKHYFGARAIRSRDAGAIGLEAAGPPPSLLQQCYRKGDAACFVGAARAEGAALILLNQGMYAAFSSEMLEAAGAVRLFEDADTVFFRLPE